MRKPGIGCVIGAAIAGAAAFAGGFALGCVEGGRALMDEEIHMNDLDPDGFDLGLTRTDMGCIRVPEEEKEDEK